MEVVIHLGKIRITRKIKSQFFSVHCVKVIFNLFAFYKCFCLFNGWDGNFEIKKPINIDVSLQRLMEW